jgi:hypothetical protein
MTPTAVLDAAQLIATAGATTAVIVQLVIMYAGVETPRARVATAVIAGIVLTIAYAISNALLIGPNIFALMIAAVTIASTGAGIHSASTAAITNQPSPPAPTP